MAKLMDTRKDGGNDSFVNFVITDMICKDPWGRLVRYMSFKLTQLPCMCFSKAISFIDQRTNERATRTAGGIRTRSLARE